MNETLADAEHLEIPGVIMKPSHKSPDVRYQIDRLFLIASGVEMEDACKMSDSCPKQVYFIGQRVEGIFDPA
jgi:hypothetical protein